MRILVLVLGVFMSICATASAEKRLALIVANGEYDRGTIGRLVNPTNDARLMKDALEAVGFEVTMANDLTLTDLRRAVRDHRDRLSAAGAGSVSFFYYSGHGAADAEANGNFLVPIGAEIKRPRDLSIEGLSVSDIVRSFSEATNNFVVIDACRNFPFEFADSRSLQKGFIPAQEKRGTLIAFATSPGTTASDEGENGGPYARALSTILKMPGADHIDVFKGVQEVVDTETGGQQFPWYRDGVRGRFKFSATPAASTAPATTTTRAVANLPPAPATAMPFVDARSALPTTRAALITGDPADLPDFALFKECETCPEMVVLPAGTFKMSGSPALWREDATAPRVEVNVERFAISRFETTNADWFACYGAGACPKLGFHDEADKRSKPRHPFEMEWYTKLDAAYGDEDAPSATYVDESNDSPVVSGYLRYAKSLMSGGYRLPSEVEWEYASLGGAETEYSWGDQPPTRQASRPNGAQIAIGEEAGYQKPVAVGSFRPNPFGLFDMIGNVWEVTSACGADPYARIAAECGSLVTRGGGSFDGPWEGAANNEPIRHDNFLSGAGIRLARTL